ncbi:hypothetical protein [Bacillus tuaregi]|uniref:hypothetical protein n=1 Tax=Bacillus tuaregi TaxID=1816695 RepID=UPI0008F881D4|nr:hypothetical protein [Bacillus tuaregi]
MKKFWCFTLAMLLSTSLVACGTDEGVGETEDATTSTEVEETETEETSNEPIILEEAKYAEALMEDIQILTDEQLELSQESYDFIVANHSLLPAKTDEAITEAKGKVDTSVTAKHLNKNAQPYFQTFVSYQGNVVSVEEAPLDNGETISITHVLDDEMNSYQVLLYKTTGDILEEDLVQFWGVPVGASSFENISGGTTNVQNFFGAHIEKLN